MLAAAVRQVESVDPATLARELEVLGRRVGIVLARRRINTLYATEAKIVTDNDVGRREQLTKWNQRWLG